MHLIAAHHGRARPHFPSNEGFDPERIEEAAEVNVREVPRRFARLQRKYGRWGLAYLESLVRARRYPGITGDLIMNRIPEPNIRIKVDPTNPGQFFACCGLLELADRLLDGAEGWFEDSKFLIRPLGFVDARALNLGGLLQKIAGANFIRLIQMMTTHPL